MKILICLMGIGNYAKLIKKQYDDIQKYFLPATEKHFILFSDQDFNLKNTLFIKVDKMDWIGVISKKFEYILRFISYIKRYQWFLCLDADIDFLKTIPEKEFFCHDKPYFGVLHPAVGRSGTFDDNPHCRAYVRLDEDRSTYWQACLWGGKSEYIRKLISKIKTDIDEDTKKNILAKWNDESYLNRFFIDNKKDVYTYIDSDKAVFGLGHDCFFNKKIVHKNLQWLERNGKKF